MPNDSLTSSEYTHWLGEVKSQIQTSRVSAAHALNRELILLYWEIGRGIVEKQQEFGWGAAVIDQLSKDLKSAFPQSKGFSSRNLRDMKRTFLSYSDTQIWRPLVAKFAPSGKDNEIWRHSVAKLEDQEILKQLRETVSTIPWGHNLLILNKLSDPSARIYYLQATRQLGWTRAVLMNQIKADAYSRSLADDKQHNFALAMPEHLAEQAEETLKSSYNLEFLGLGQAIKERELEDGLINKLKDFILELGYGFCFIGRQYRVIAGKKEYFIDLLFYHRFLKCLVAVELKVGEFKPEYAGKMDFYLNILNSVERAPDDNPSLGIILCAEKDDCEVEFALKSKGNPIGVADYQLKPTLPKDLKGKLPTAKELGAAIGLPTKAKKKK
jgi:predicted nuclease of restriction endonuclease-like (RecB) superfamily